MAISQSSVVNPAATPPKTNEVFIRFDFMSWYPRIFQTPTSRMNAGYSA
jgi:hypothetical protein